jgi:hypothetical protein
MANFQDKFVKCPFYLNKQSNQNVIRCEGVIEGTSLSLSFQGSKKWYVKSLCCKNYEHCRIYRMLLQKYNKKAEGD